MDVAHLKLHCPECNELLTFVISVHASTPITFESRPDGVPKALANVAVGPVVHYCETRSG